MESQEVSEGSGVVTGDPLLDLQKLRGREEKAASTGNDGTPEKASKYTERERALRMEASRRYRAKNADAVREQNRESKRLMRLEIGGREKERQSQTAWRERNRENLRQGYRDFYAKNKESRNAESRQARKNMSPEKKAEIKARRKSYYDQNKALVNARNNEWASKNREHLQKRAKQYLPRRNELKRLRRAADPVQRIKDSSRTRVGFILRKAGIPKFNKTFELIGCTPDFFKSHIESQFKPGMTWENYGTWEIDHVRPLASYCLSDGEQLRQAFHYSNCQPLWKIENRMKNCKIPLHILSKGTSKCHSPPQR